MWLESTLILGDQIADAADLAGWRLTVGEVAAGAPRMLLAHVQLEEDASAAASYQALTVLALEGDGAARVGRLDLLHPLLALAPREQQTVRGWLIGRHWPAWARAALGVRALLGDAAPPIALAAAARAWMLPLATLSGAAAAERLPTIRAGDRHLIYSATIGEALERGLLHPARGRPRRGQS